VRAKHQEINKSYYYYVAVLFFYIKNVLNSLINLSLLSLHITVAYADKPKILIADSVVRAAPGHLVWCFAEGSPPINISIFKNSTSLANGTGLVMTALNETGIYSCVASNEAGTDSRDLSVTIVGKM